MTAPLPTGFRVELDPAARQLDDHTWCGGSPLRLVRLSDAGRDALTELMRGSVASRAGGLLARRLTDAGIAHPRPPVAAPAAAVTIVVPVKDRADLLDRCLSSVGDTYPVVVVDDGSVAAPAIRAVADRHGARLIRHETNRGPAAARNTGLAAATTDVVCFLDSDCVATRGWIEELLPHLADPEVAIVAPRVRALSPRTWAGDYSRANSCLDMGPREGLVAAGTRLSYVPSAALLARRQLLLEVAGDAVFDPVLRHGEDVDLVWRLADRAYRVRYVPEVTVGHVEPTTWRALLVRRFRYGTSAGPLAARHPGRLAPAAVSPPGALLVAATLAGSPAGALAGIAGIAAARRRTMRRVGVAAWSAPSTPRLALDAWLQAGTWARQAGVPVAATALTASWLLPGRRRALRRTAAVALVATPSVVDWLRRRPDLDVARFAAGQLAEDIAYGAGVWTGSVAARTAAPLFPRVVRVRGRS